MHHHFKTTTFRSTPKREWGKRNSRVANISCSLLNKAGYKVDTSSERSAQSTIRIMIYMRLSRLFVGWKRQKQLLHPIRMLSSAFVKLRHSQAVVQQNGWICLVLNGETHLMLMLAKMKNHIRPNSSRRLCEQRRNWRQLCYSPSNMIRILWYASYFETRIFHFTEPELCILLPKPFHLCLRWLHFEAMAQASLSQRIIRITLSIH